MEEALRSAIVNTAAVGARVYPITLPQVPTFPAVTYQIISAPRLYTQDGQAGITTFRVQIDIWAEKYEDTRTARDTIIPVISAAQFEGLGSPPVRLNRIFVDNERDLYEPALDEAGPKLFRKSIDILVTAEQD